MNKTMWNLPLKANIPDWVVECMMDTTVNRFPNSILGDDLNTKDYTRSAITACIECECLDPVTRKH